MSQSDELARVDIERAAAIIRDHTWCVWRSNGHDVLWSCGVIHPGPIHMQPTTRDRHVAALILSGDSDA